jgi:hypothetical protein
VCQTGTLGFVPRKYDPSSRAVARVRAGGSRKHELIQYLNRFPLAPTLSEMMNGFPRTVALTMSPLPGVTSPERTMVSTEPECDHPPHPAPLFRDNLIEQSSKYNQPHLSGQQKKAIVDHTVLRLVGIHGGE